MWRNMSDSMASPEDLKGHLGWERSAQAWGLASELARLRMALDDVRALRGKIQGSSDHRFFTLSVPQGWSRQQAIDNVPSSVLINALQKSAYKALKAALGTDETTAPPDTVEMYFAFVRSKKGELYTPHDGEPLTVNHDVWVEHMGIERREAAIIQKNTLEYIRYHRPAIRPLEAQVDRLEGLLHGTDETLVDLLLECLEHIEPPSARLSTLMADLMDDERHSGILYVRSDAAPMHWCRQCIDEWLKDHQQSLDNPRLLAGALPSASLHRTGVLHCPSMQHTSIDRNATESEDDFLARVYEQPVISGSDAVPLHELLSIAVENGASRTKILVVSVPTRMAPPGMPPVVWLRTLADHPWVGDLQPPLSTPFVGLDGWATSWPTN